MRNTEQVLGLVVYTGHETKELKNISQARYKQSKVEKMTNKSIFVIVSTLILLSFFASFYGTIWNLFNEHGTSQYLGLAPKDSSSAWDSLWILVLIKEAGIWILTLNNFVPISLITTLEMLRFW